MLERLGEQEGRRLVLLLVAELVVPPFRPRCDDGEVLEPDAVARAEEDARELHARVRVVDRARVREDLHDGGELQQPREADDLDGNPSLGERVLERNEQTGLAAEHRDARPRLAVVVERDDVVADPGRLRLLVGDAGKLHLSVPVGAEGPELLVGVRALVLRDLLDHLVGGGEDPGPAPEVRVERKLLGRRSVRAREPLREPQQVEQARAAPGVDVLVGVADRRHREPLAEHTVEEVCLRDVRVLILIEDQRAEA